MHAQKINLILIVTMGLVGLVFTGCGKKGGKSGGQKCVLGKVSVCKKQCKSGKVKSCMTLGRTYQAGVGAKFDSDSAMKAFSTACDKGHGPACYALALFYNNTFFKKRHNAKRAHALLLKGCKLKHGDSCAHIASLLMADETKVPKAMAFLKTHCKNGAQGACLAVASNHDSGRGKALKKDKALATKMYKKLCDQGMQEACVHLHNQRIWKKGSKDEVAKGMAELDKACSKGSGLACDWLGGVYDNRGEHKAFKTDKKRALKYYEKACALFSGCFEAGMGYHHGLGEVKVDLKKAFKFYYRDCMLGSSFGCETSKKVLIKMASKKR